MWQYLSNRPFVKIPIYINVIRDLIIFCHNDLMYQDDSDRPHKKGKIILEGYKKVRFCGQIKIIGGFLYFCCMPSYPNNRNHFLRTDHRAILDSLDASQQNKFGSVRYSVTNTTFPNSMLNDNFDFSRD